MTMRSRKCRWSWMLAAAGALAPVQATIAATASVSVSNTAAGVTPRYIGYNMGHYMPGANTSAWTQYSGVNAYRVWASAGDYDPDGTGPYSNGISTLTQFDSAKAQVRASPESNGYINWAGYNTKFAATQSGRNKVKLNYI